MMKVISSERGNMQDTAVKAMFYRFFMYLIIYIAPFKNCLILSITY